MQITNHLKEVLKIDDVAVMIEADHLCVTARGVEDRNSNTITRRFSGKFEDMNTRDEFLKIISLND